MDESPIQYLKINLLDLEYIPLKWLLGKYIVIQLRIPTLTGIIHIFIFFRGDHTSVDFLLAIVPPQTEIVVFSIDGSFSASVSVTGRDPKVRPGAVDIVR